MMRAPGRLLFAPFAGLTALLAPSLSFAAESTQWIDLISHPVGYAALSFFVLANLFSLGSAAGVALMGQARGVYIFLAHLRWTPEIAPGCFASIVVHLGLNG